MGDGSDIDVEVAAPPTVSLRRWLLVLMLLSFNLIDMALTRAVLSFGGREANPLMEPIVDDVGLTLMLKVIVCSSAPVCVVTSVSSSSESPLRKGVGSVADLDGYDASAGTQRDGVAQWTASFVARF